MLIPESKTPMFIPYGYASIGKTMLIQRLMRCLRNYGYMCRPEVTFSTNPIYSQICEQYIEEAFKGNVAAGTTETILFSVLDQRGMKVCNLVDMAGEYQYDINNPHVFTSPEMLQLIHTPNPKIWGFVIEYNNSLSIQQRQGYVHSIRNFALNALTAKDKVIIIYNKVDLTPYSIPGGKTNWRGLFDSADSTFPDIFNPFEETNKFKRFLKGRYNFKLLPFMSGLSHKGIDQYGNEYISFVDGPDEYPKQLWHNIVKCLR